MAKHRRKFFDYETSNPNKERYIVLTKTMLMNDNYLSLSANSQKLYIYMKMWASGKGELSFGYNIGKNIMAKATMSRSIKELVEKGFIEITHISRQVGFATKYKFSNKWYKDKT